MTDSTEVKQPILGKTPYDVAKDTVTIYLPALAAFYSTMALVWGLPYTEQVVASIGAVALLMGAILKISSNQYAKVAEVEKKQEIRDKVESLTNPSDFDGQLIVNHSDPMVDNFRVKVDEEWNELGKKDFIVLKVEDQTTLPGK